MGPAPATLKPFENKYRHTKSTVKRDEDFITEIRFYQMLQALRGRTFAKFVSGKF